MTAKNTHKQPGPREATAFANSLGRWAAQPVRHANRRAVVWTGLLMMLLVLATRSEPEQAKITRSAALVFIGMHGFMHVMLLTFLRRHSAQGLKEADAALKAYLAPRRITNIDLGVAWMVFAAVIALFRAAFPVVMPPG